MGGGYTFIFIKSKVGCRYNENILRILTPLNRLNRNNSIKITSREPGYFFKQKNLLRLLSLFLSIQRTEKLS